MRNTGIRYNSKERMPTVLSEMAELLPPLSGEQLAVLEADLLANGCYAPVIVNEDMVIVDGHNRQKLCQQHGIRLAVSHINISEENTVKVTFQQEHRERTEHGTDSTEAGTDHTGNEKC